ncbi:MAG TPA: CBS domain-containing protein [Candidatus Dormibacteraeota bacterium]|nr:CBS domain-containing protein [Candidatus Dormibacteraeota bacterium]
MGFTKVADYAAGKQAWLEDNQAREGKSTEETWLGDVADASIPTCRLDERTGDLRQRVEADGRQICVVTTDEGIVLGLLRKQALAAEPSRTVEDVMQSGPKTFRPNLTLEELLSYMRDHEIKTNALITTAEGRLLGVIARADLEATLEHEAAEARGAGSSDG